MFYAEMKKIWKPGIAVLIFIISVLMFFTFMFRCVKPFLFEDGSDSTEISLELCSRLLEQYGNTIEEEEFAEIENEYKQLLYGANSMMVETELFLQNGIENYEDYFQYMQNAIQGYEGYDYNIYSEMREQIIRATGKSSMYFEFYEDMMQQYRSAGAGRTSIMPFEILVYANAYFVSMMICCLICGFLLAAPVMVNDRVNHVIASQYSSKRGKKIHRIQYLCMTISVLIITSITIGLSILIWKATGTLQFANSGISSFLNHETSVLPITYGHIILCFMIITYLLTLGIANIIFYLSAKSVNAINMLIKTIPVLTTGCFIGLFMEGLFCESNRIYKIFQIPGCELMVALIIFIVGVFLNVRNYRTLRRRDV